MTNNKPKNKVWTPEYDKLYYYVFRDGTSDNYWNGDFIDESYYAIGNCFKTKEEAINAVERLKIRAELQRYADEHNDMLIDWKDEKQEKWTIYYNHSHKQLRFASFEWYQDAFQIYFTSEEVARAAVQAIGEERIKEYIFGVE